MLGPSKSLSCTFFGKRRVGFVATVEDVHKSLWRLVRRYPFSESLGLVAGFLGIASVFGMLQVVSTVKEIP